MRCAKLFLVMILISFLNFKHPLEIVVDALYDISVSKWSLTFLFLPLLKTKVLFLALLDCFFNVISICRWHYISGVYYSQMHFARRQQVVSLSSSRRLWKTLDVCAASAASCSAMCSAVAPRTAGRRRRCVQTWWTRKGARWRIGRRRTLTRRPCSRSCATSAVLSKPSTR